MLTVITKKIDGFDIIIGFDRPLIDPVESSKEMKKALRSIPEFKKMEALQVEIKKHIDAKRRPTKDMAIKLKSLSIQVREKSLLMAKDNVKYFTPKKGEIVVSDEESSEYMALMESAISEGKLLALDKSLLVNHRGAIYYSKKGKDIEKKQIVKIGEDFPVDAIFDLSLEDAKEYTIQELVKQASGMSSEEKASMFKFQKSLLVKDASVKILERELDGEDPKLVKSSTKEWYGQEIVKLQSIYS